MTRQSLFPRAAELGLAFGLILATVVPVRAQKPKEWNPTIDPAQFTTNVTNPYFPLPIGRTWRYSTPDGSEQLTVEVTGQTRTVMGVQTLVVRETSTENGQVVEISDNYYAQDSAGNVWYFGENTQILENGVVVSTEGSWEAGVNGALPGIIMEASPQHGDTYFQEYAPGIAQDMATVLTTSDTVTVPYGTFGGVLRTKEWSPIENSSLEHKYYAPNIGLIMEQDANVLLQLVSVS